ncbi:hypothetical protein C8F04DRAFT_1064132 [Mycena alexandri]|uniref:F-box domain-containing protein n=1 Tax=Mycena alexandri TaxID=1745969 RepID=A0AAD6XIK8_9AGAR|nr:hypothetical protein C8F04DRAFT_1064132 [Mycena alexandri]
MTSPVDQVPTELWLEVFQNLPSDSLIAVSLTHRAFYNMSRHLVFAHFHFHPYGSTGTTLQLPDIAHIRRAHDRLAFWSSDDIAAGVRSCSVTPWPARSAIFRDSRPYPASSPSPLWLPPPLFLLDQFVAQLDRFIGLKQLYLRDVYLTQPTITKLCRLPALTNLHIHMCGIAHGARIDTTSLQLRVSVFEFTRRNGMDDGYTLWLPILRPETLRKLEVSANPIFFNKIIRMLPPFHRVHTLSLTMDLDKRVDNLRVLSKFPAVQTLSLSYWRNNTFAWAFNSDEAGPCVAMGVLPVLEHYKGYFRSLNTLLAIPTLRHLEAFELLGSGHPANFMQQLVGLPTPLNLTLLEVSFEGFDHDALILLSMYFPQLTQLRLDILVKDIAINSANLQATTFFRTLGESPTVPPTLERLAICWKFTAIGYQVFVPFATAGAKAQVPSHPGVHDLPDLALLRSSLRRRCPRLTFLWLDGDDFLLHWRNLPHGEVEKSALNIDQAPPLRQEISDLWDLW